MGQSAKDYYLNNMDAYHEAVRKYVCDHCEDLGADGQCHTKDPEGCGVFRNLPELIRIVHSMHERKIEPYMKAVREHVCSQCRNGASGEKCAVREELDCALDRYLPLLICAVEEADRNLGIG